MFGSNVLDLGVGMIFVFFLVSVVCSTISDKISSVLNLRAQHLEKGLRNLIMNGDASLVRKLYASPIIRSIVPSDGKPMAIPAQMFMLAMFDAFVPGASGKTTVDELSAAVQAMDDHHPLKKTFLGLITAADTKIDGLRSNFERWFNTAEMVMTSKYREQIYVYSFIIGISVAVILNVDSIAIADSLWRDSALRSSVITAATTLTTKAIQTNDTLVTQQNAQKAIQILGDLALPIGWQSSPIYPTDWAQTMRQFSLASVLVKIFGWLITAFAGAQGAPFWFDVLKKATNR